MCRSLIATLLLTLCIGASSEVRAWNDAGHMTIARIAWDTLTPDERISIVEILKKHPHLEALLTVDRPTEATDEEWIFLRAAVWADYIRPPKGFPRDDIAKHPLYQFHRGTWHYVNFPYTQGQVTSTMPEKSLPDETNVLKQLDITMSVLLKKDAQDAGRQAGVSDEQNRAIRLTWLFHLSGDLHQPMHSVALVDRTLFPDSPHTDQGGNKLAVRSDEQSIPKNLHWAWDEMFATDSHFDQICRYSERLTHDPSLEPGQLTELKDHPTFKHWAAESYEAAIEYAYLNGQLKYVLWDDFNSGRLQAKDIPVIPAPALQRSKKIAERRICLAGYRLAEKLRHIAKASTAPNP